VDRAGQHHRVGAYRGWASRCIDSASLIDRQLAELEALHHSGDLALNRPLHRGQLLAIELDLSRGAGLFPD